MLENYRWHTKFQDLVDNDYLGAVTFSPGHSKEAPKTVDTASTFFLGAIFSGSTEYP